MEAYDFVVVAGSSVLDIDDAYALSQLAKSCAVYSTDSYAAATLAEALEKHGLPHPAIFGSEDARLGTAA